MEGLICGGIAPHGSSVIAEISGEEFELFKPTRDAMDKLGKEIMKNKPDTIIVLTPHGLRLGGYNAIYTSEYCRGKLSGNGQTVALEYKCDKNLANEILKSAIEENIPSVGCNFGALGGEESNIEMDWGTFIPLWFCNENCYKPQIVVIDPTRDIPRGELVKFGEIIGRICEKSGKKIALIVSADHGHCHNPEGPYGYNEASKEYDEKILSIIKDNNLKQLLDIDNNLVDNAKPDSLWQMLILYGALNIKPMYGKLYSYQVPTYFGMAVASYETI